MPSPRHKQQQLQDNRAPCLLASAAAVVAPCLRASAAAVAAVAVAVCSFCGQGSTTCFFCSTIIIITSSSAAAAAVHTASRFRCAVLPAFCYYFSYLEEGRLVVVWLLWLVDSRGRERWRQTDTHTEREREVVVGRRVVGSGKRWGKPEIKKR